MGSSYRVINSTAPIRICDVGGWTDTWFAEYGAVFNIGVYPLVEVQVFVYPRCEREEQITVFAENYAEQFTVDPENLIISGKHALLKAAFALMEIPDSVAIDAHLYCEVPPGASTGTSAAASVALIKALDTLTPGRMSPYEAARTAHRIETEILHLQCGVQDQLCAAYGGINFIEIYKYPHASVSPLYVADDVWWELQRRLVLVYLGSAHVSSDVHKIVIKDFESSGAEDPRLVVLRKAAQKAKAAVLAADFDLLAEAMIENTEAQRKMHKAILGEKAARVIEAARSCGAQGWKLNGAGGQGGSITLLFGETSRDKRQFIERLSSDIPDANVISTHLSPFGLRTWESKQNG